MQLSVPVQQLLIQSVRQRDTLFIVVGFYGAVRVRSQTCILYALATDQYSIERVKLHKY